MVRGQQVMGFSSRRPTRTEGASARRSCQGWCVTGKLFALHWRLRNFHITPNAMDFAEFARNCWFGPLDITGLPLVDGDLEIKGQRIDRADPDAFRAALRAAQERHQAANWLRAGPKLYADASVAT